MTNGNVSDRDTRNLATANNKMPASEVADIGKCTRKDLEAGNGGVGGVADDTIDSQSLPKLRSSSIHQGETFKHVGHVSNVDFNNLRKVTTSSSRTSDASARTKSNPLARLFTRNKSSNSIQTASAHTSLRKANPSHHEEKDKDKEREKGKGKLGKEEEEEKEQEQEQEQEYSQKEGRNGGDKAGEDNVTEEGADNQYVRRSGSSIHIGSRISSGHRHKDKQKLPSKTKLHSASLELERPPSNFTDGQDSYSTTSQNSSPSSLKRKQKKLSLASPVMSIQNFFHKPLGSAQLKAEGKGRKDSLPSQSKNVVGLSSSNSNSIVSDPDLAAIFRFTQGNLFAEDSEGNSDYSTLVELQRKMFTPTDLYIYQKINKHHPHNEVLSEILDSKTAIKTNRDQPALSKFQLRLFQILKPLFDSSGNNGNFNAHHQYQHHTSNNINGISKINNNAKSSDWLLSKQLGVSVEELGNYVKDVFQEANPFAATNIKLAKYRKGVRSPSKIQVVNTINPHLEESNGHALQTFSREFNEVLDMCMHMLIDGYQGGGKNNGQEGRDVINDSPIHRWDIVSSCWRHFNMRTRFLVITIMHPLELLLNRDYVEKLGCSKYQMLDADTYLIQAFSRVILKPMLLSRMDDREDASISSLQMSPSMLTDLESQALFKSKTTTETLLACMGTIMSNPNFEFSEHDPHEDKYLSGLDALSHELRMSMTIAN